PEPDVDVVKRGERSHVVEHAFAQSAPETLHLAARLRRVRAGVDERDAAALAAYAKGVARIRRAVVEIERIGQSVAAHGPAEQTQHVDLALAVHGLQRDDETGMVVEHAVNTQRHTVTVDEQIGSVAYVAVPQSTWALGLPAQARVRAA